MSGAILVAASGRIPPLTAVLNDISVFGNGFVPGTLQAFSPVTCNVVGGIPPYSYNWTYVSGDGSVYANSDGSATTRFSRYTTDTTLYTAVWKCVVTDAAAATVDSDTVTVQFEGFS